MFLFLEPFSDALKPSGNGTLTTSGQLSSSICASMLPSRRKREFFSIELIEYDKKKFVLTNKFVAVPFKTPNRAMVVNTFWGVSCWPVRTKQDRAVRVVRTGYEMMKKSTADWREASFHTLWSSFLKKEKKNRFHYAVQLIVGDTVA